MSVSKIDIANRALIQLGARPITSFTDDLDTARVMQARYESDKRELLRMYKWNCATQQRDLVENTIQPKFDYKHSFKLPPDVLRVIRVNRPTYWGAKTSDAEFRVLGRDVHTDVSPCSIEAIIDVDEGLMDETFKGALEALLASRAAYTLVQSSTMQTQMENLFQTRLAEARVADILEGTGEEIAVDGLSSARVTGWRNASW
jgi:hypothetical protein